MMRFRCPHCMQILEVDQPTDAILCPACEGWCRIPSQPQAVRESVSSQIPARKNEEAPQLPRPNQDAVTDRPPGGLAFSPRDEEEIEPVEFEIIEDGEKRRRAAGRLAGGGEVFDAGIRTPRRKGMKVRRRMALARLGLGFYYAKFLCIIVAITLSIASFVFAFLPGGATLSSVTGCLYLPTYAVTPVLGLVGGLLCFWVPKKARARLLVQISFGLDAFSILAPFTSLISLLTGGAGAALGLIVAGILAGIAACVLFLLFLRALAYYLGDSVSGDAAMQVMFQWLVVMVVPPLLLLVAVTTAVKGESIILAQIFIFVGFPLWLYFYVRALLNLLNLIVTIRQRIASRFDLG